VLTEAAVLAAMAVVLLGVALLVFDRRVLAGR